MRTTARAFVLFLALAATLPLSGFAGRRVKDGELPPRPGWFTPSGTGDFSFVVIGDSRPWGSSTNVVSQNEHFRGNIERINALNPDFTVNDGDLILGYTNDAAMINREWDEYDKTVAMIKSPYLAMPGNHDVWDAASEKIWRKRYGPGYYSWNHKGCHFIVLSSEVIGQAGRIKGKQLAWLKRDLRKAASARRIFVFLHRPLWSPTRDVTSPPEWYKNVHPVLAKYCVDTVFAGHDHQYCLYPETNGVRYVVTGGGGAEIRGDRELAGEFYHFMKVDVSGNSSSMTVVTPTRELPPDYVTMEKIQTLTGALKIEPAEKVLQEIAASGAATVRFNLSNASPETAKAVVTWNCEGTDWTGEPAETVIPAGGAADMAVRAQTSSRIFPLPKANVELVAGDRKLFKWNIMSDLKKRLVPVSGFVKSRSLTISQNGSSRLDVEITNSWNESVFVSAVLNTTGTQWQAGDPTPDTKLEPGSIGVLSLACAAPREGLYPGPKLTVTVLVGGRQLAQDSSKSAVTPVVIREAACIKAAGSVNVDGRITEPVWSVGEPAADFVLSRAAGRPTLKTRFRTAYDNKALYISVECDEPAPKGIVTKERKRDGEVWADDEVEVFVDPANDRKTYFQFMLGAGGVRYDARRVEEKFPFGDVKWNGKWTGKTTIGKDRWTAEFSIPFATMGVPAPKPGETWGLNVARHRAQAPEEYSSWCSGGFHAPELFQDLVFK